MLSQSEADILLSLEKRFVAAPTIRLAPGVDETHDLVGALDTHEEHFLLDIWCGTKRTTKLKYQTRGRKVFVLARIDIDGAPHTNPNGDRIDGTHIHLYREGYEDRWAWPLDPGQFSNVTDSQTLLADFCRLCHIERSYVVQGALR
jgi:hypothetical protein